MSTPYTGRHRPPRAPRSGGVRAAQAGAVVLLSGGLLGTAVVSAAADPAPPSAAEHDPGWEPDFTEPRPLETPPAAAAAPTPLAPAASSPPPTSGVSSPPSAASPSSPSTADPGAPSSEPPEDGGDTPSSERREDGGDTPSSEQPEDGGEGSGEAPGRPTPSPRGERPAPSAPTRDRDGEGRGDRETRREPPREERSGGERREERETRRERRVPPRAEKRKAETPRRSRAQKADSGDRAAVLDIAASLSGIPYVWGGTSTRGFDCSGYTQHVFRKAGVSLPRTAAQQQDAVRRVRSPRPGDLVFFGSPAHHVGIYAGEGRMYDAPRRGRTTGLHRIWSSNVTYGRP